MTLSISNVMVSDGYRATYVASWAAFAPVATPTYILSLTGSSTKTLRLLRMGISATQTTAGIINIQVNKLSSALTGGTPVAPTGIIPFDSTSPAASGVPKTWTANPTGGGALVGAIRNVRLTVPAPAVAGAAQNQYIFDFTANYSQNVYIRGTAEVVGLSLLSVTLTGGSVACWVEWTEE